MLPGLDRAIVVTSRVATPQHFQDELLSFRGAGFGMAPSADDRAPGSARIMSARTWTGSTSSAPARIPGPGCRACSARPRSWTASYGGAACSRTLTTWPPVPGHAVPTGSRSFAAAARVLPARVHAPATGAVRVLPRGGRPDRPRRRRGRRWTRLHRRLDRVYAGQPSCRTGRPRAGAVVAGVRACRARFCWTPCWRGSRGMRPGGATRRLDATAYDYAARVAGAVGAAMAVLMGVRHPADIARACDLGVAMQLTNIARDVGEDARAGRLYLPLAWLREAGVDPAGFLARPGLHGPALAGVVRRLLAAAETGCTRGRRRGSLPSAAGLPPGHRAARLLYAEIGAEVARNGYDSVSRPGAWCRSWRKALRCRAGIRDRRRSDPVGRRLCRPAGPPGRRGRRRRPRTGSPRRPGRRGSPGWWTLFSRTRPARRRMGAALMETWEWAIMLVGIHGPAAVGVAIRAAATSAVPARSPPKRDE